MARQTAAAGTRAAPAVRFEALAFQVDVKRRQQARTAARGVVRRALPGRAWRVEVLNRRTGEFVARLEPGARPLSVASAWDASYAVRADPRVIYAEPLFEVPIGEQYPGPRGPRPRSGAGTDADPGTEGDCEWSLKTLNVPKAWAMFTGTPGAGVVVGHPDTGYTPHPEIVGPRLKVGDGYDFEDGRADPRDPLPAGLLVHPGHGTSTSSLIISSRGPQPGTSGPAFVSGTAPGAALIPIRTTPSVVLWSMTRLTKAILYAVDRGAHVISISLGGPFPSTALHNAVRAAEARGVIVLGAAGNEVRFVVFPAAFDEVIAVAASRIDDTPWPGSCRGPAVDVTAPGASVWRARTERSGGAEIYSVERGSGTSYAVAPTAGLAALWLSFHGRGALIARYGRERLATAFKHQLQRSCRVPAGWDTDNFGPGIADARALLAAALPAAAPSRAARSLRRRAVSEDRAMLEVLVHQLTPAPRSGVSRALADLLRVDETALVDVLDDVGAELAMRVGTDPTLRRQLRDAAVAHAGRSPRRAAGAARAAGRRLSLGGGSRRLRACTSAHRGRRR